MSLKIDEVAKAVHHKQVQQSEKREIAVYMSDDFFAQCKAEIGGQISSAAFEFEDRNTVRGCKVYLAGDWFDRDGGEPHPPYRVVEL